VNDFLRNLNAVLKYSASGLDGALVHAVLRPKGKTAIDTTALGVLGDHLQELGNPMGKALSHAATGGELLRPVRLNGDTFSNLRTDDGTHAVISREGNDRDGNPLLWVSVSRWKRVELPNGHVRHDKDKNYEFAVPAHVVPEVAEWLESRKKPAPVTPDDIDHNQTQL
jgi:hypothetical protein